MSTLLEPHRHLSTHDDAPRTALFAPPPPMPEPVPRSGIDLDVVFMLLVLGTAMIELLAARLASPDRAMAGLVIDGVLLAGLFVGKRWARSWMLARCWLGALLAPVLALSLIVAAPALALAIAVTGALDAGWIWYLTRAEVRERFARLR